jgi:hypothetical protein
LAQSDLVTQRLEPRDHLQPHLALQGGDGPPLLFVAKMSQPPRQVRYSRRRSEKGLDNVTI